MESESYIPASEMYKNCGEQEKEGIETCLAAIDRLDDLVKKGDTNVDHWFSCFEISSKESANGKKIEIVSLPGWDSISKGKFDKTYHTRIMQGVHRLAAISQKVDAWSPDLIPEKIKECLKEDPVAQCESDVLYNLKDFSNFSPDEMLLNLNSYLIYGGDDHEDIFSLEKVDEINATIEQPGYGKCREAWGRAKEMIVEGKVPDIIGRYCKGERTTKLEERALREFEKKYGAEVVGTCVYLKDEGAIVSYIEDVIALEKRHSGLAKSLNKKWGIINFSSFASNDEDLLELDKFDLEKDKKDELFSKKISILLRLGSLKTVRMITDYLKNNPAFQKKDGNTVYSSSEGAEIMIKDFFPVIDRAFSLSFFEEKEDREPFKEDVLVSAANTMDKLFHVPDVDYRELLESWVTSYAPRIKENLSSIVTLQTEAPGSVAMLFKKFGIRHFERYPNEALLKQCKEKVSGPFGIILGPSHDWNGAFSKSELWKGVYERLKASGYGLKIFEADSKTELARRLITAIEDGKKISFAFIGGHGTEGSIQFGERNDRSLLRVEDLAGSGVKRSKKFFENGATILLSSCSTGKEGGFAQKLSGVIDGATVIAPDKPISLQDIEVMPEGGKITFKPVYSLEAEKKYVSSNKV